MQMFFLSALAQQLLVNAPMHLGWLILFGVGVGVALTRSRLAGALLVGGALAHAASILLHVAQTIVVMQLDYDTDPEIIYSSFAFASVGLATIQYGLLVAAVWAGRSR